MVNQLWYRVSRKWSRLKPERPHPRVFSECRYHEEVKTWYLIYRWAIFILWALIIICSIFELGSIQPHGKNYLWGIYLTNWDLVLGLLQSFFGALIVSRRWRLQSCSDFDPNNLQMNFLERTYWFLFVVTSTMALSVTVIYWSVVYNPKLHSVDFLNILLHVFNSVLMLLDMSIVKVPFFLINVWWSLLIALSYVLFSVIYFAAGGLDKLGNHFIYAILDWKVPGRTVIVCLIVSIFLMFVHCIFCLVLNYVDRKCKPKEEKPKTVSARNVEMTV